METIFLIAITSILNIVCFFVGAKVGQKAVNGQEIKLELPKVNPIEIYRENKEKKESDKVNAKIEAILRNADRYDGTSKGQEDIE